MKLYLFCTFIAVLRVVSGVDVKCHRHYDDYTSCEITEPVTIKTGEKLNIISDGNLNSIKKLAFGLCADDRFHISTVPSEIFEQLPNLESFELYATVNILNKGDFEKAGKLKRLAINNQLKTIPAGVLDSAKNLKSLSLLSNEIAEIEDNAFDGIKTLLSIDLENNKLTIIKRNTFNGLDTLEYLNLATNQIETIEENALKLPNLKQLYVNDNKLTSLPDHLFAAIPLLKSFHAQRNQINRIGTSLYGLKNIMDLFLAVNKLVDVDLLAFSQMSALKLLYINNIDLMSHNISRIDVKEPSKSVLSVLSLSGNQLANNEDWKKLALVFPQLEFINVENTKYSGIDLGDKTLRQQFPRLRTVYVSSGEWRCDWLKSFVESSEKDGIEIKLMFPSNTNGKNVNGIGCA